MSVSAPPVIVAAAPASNARPAKSRWPAIIWLVLILFAGVVIYQLSLTSTGTEDAAATADDVANATTASPKITAASYCDPMAEVATAESASYFAAVCRDENVLVYRGVIKGTESVIELPAQVWEDGFLASTSDGHHYFVSPTHFSIYLNSDILDEETILNWVLQ